MRGNGKRRARCGILVTGGSGRLGRMLRVAWAGQNGGGVLWQVRGRAPGPGETAWDILQDPYAGPAPRIVLHFAGPTSGPRLADNAPLAVRTCSMAARAGAAHVFIVSSAAVYGPTPGGPACEEAPLAPVSAYGRAKAAMEQAVGAWAAARPDGAMGLTILRLGNVAGADALLGPRRGRVDLDVFQGQPGGPLRPYIGPLTLTRVLGRLAGIAAQGGTLPRVLNVASPAPLSMSELARAAGIQATPRPAPDTAIAQVVLSTRRLGALYPFAPHDSLADEMVRQVRCIRDART